MVPVKKNENIKQRIVSKKKLIFTMSVGVVLLLISVTLFYINPVVLLVQNKLRLENGGMLDELIRRRLTSTRIAMYLFNVTNAERFLSGADEKVKLEEIGPFVYQEYRTAEDLEINKDPGIMRYTPKLEKVFVPEESIGDPKDFNLTVPSISMLSATAKMSKYSFLLRQVFNVVAATNRMRAFVTIRAHDHIWGYPDPLIKLTNTVVPGLIYFKSVGLLERMYDVDVDYRMEIGTRDADRFSVKKATKIQAKKKTGVRALIDNTFEYKDSYEGAAFPPNLTPEMPINIYRHGLCKTFQLQYMSTRRMPYGGDGSVYHVSNATFRDRKQCNTKGWCPEGLKDLSDCYFGFPIALSKGHFLDSDPRLLDMVEGLKPDRKIHDSEILLDPIIGVGISGSMTLQLNLFLADVGFNPQTRRLKDLVLPICNIIANSPPMIEEVQTAFHLTYVKGPYIIGTTQFVCSLLGLLLLTYSARLMYWSCLARRDLEGKDFKNKTQLPLITTSKGMNG